ncbi:MAG: aminodeoxychorismate lyase [Epsilonproteobacteria bacterium]|nr:aminodeoxychorismate lyase [Campylobacterota bacterium]
MNRKYIVVNAIAAMEVLLVFVIFLLFYLTREVHTKRVVYIPKSSTNYTIKTLQKEGEDIALWDKIFIRMFGYPQAGWIDLKATKLTKLDFLYRLTRSKAAIVKITIIPGETNYFIYRQIAKKMKLPHFRCNIEEGFLKPETFFLGLGMTKAQVCGYLYEKSIKWHKSIAKKFIGVWNYKLYKQKLIIASIIQKEAANAYEMPYISAVIYNRLKKGMKLQMDGALNYGRYSHTRVTPARIRHDYSRFNTYKYYGLPKEPVCVASKEAIKAAFFPAKVKYLYFVKCGKKHLFSTTYKAHLRNIKKCSK